jgi:beta-aspartyl-peptidase (threonine type)
MLRDAVKTAIAEFTQDTGAVCSVLALHRTGKLAAESSARLFVTASGSGTLGNTTTHREVHVLPNTIPILPRHEFMRDGRFVVGACRYPITQGHAVVLVEAISDFTTLDPHEFGNLFRFTRKAALALVAYTGVHRCALASDGTTLQLIPLHGLSDQWHRITSSGQEYHTTFPGYLSSRTGPKAPTEDLIAIQTRLMSASGLSEPFDQTFHGDPTDQNLFARIVRGELEQWRVWENDSHVAFLTPFGNTPGYTVLVPRRHLSSDVFALSEEDYAALVDAVYLVAGVIKRGLGVTRVGVFFEGFEIDYTHAKLIPVYGNDPPQTVVPPPALFWTSYPGFITTQPGPLEKDMSSLNSLVDGVCKCLASSLEPDRRFPVG